MSLPDVIEDRFSKLESALEADWDTDAGIALVDSNLVDNNRDLKDRVYKRLSLLAALHSAIKHTDYAAAKDIRDFYNRTYQTKLRPGVDEEFSGLERSVFRNKWDNDERERIVELFQLGNRKRDDNLTDDYRYRLSRLATVYSLLEETKDYDPSIPKTQKAFEAAGHYINDFPKSKVNIPKILLHKITKKESKQSEEETEQDKVQ